METDSLGILIKVSSSSLKKQYHFALSTYFSGMNANQFQEFITSLSSEFISVIDATYLNEDYIAIDLSSMNADLQKIDVSSSTAFGIYINNYLKSHNKKVAYGGYIETRDIYSRSKHFNKQDAATERNIHLGLDVWVDAETNVLAPLDGKVHSFQNNTNFGDYGPTIILEHQFNSEIFYSLYGHLSEASIENLKIDQQFKKGDVIATLGTADVNGDYAPHLHFQIIKDMEGRKGDYPGVSSKVDLDHFRQNCPDPKLMLKLL